MRDAASIGALRQQIPELQPLFVNNISLQATAGLPTPHHLCMLMTGSSSCRWSAVAKKISGRTGQQCAQRWRHKVRTCLLWRCRHNLWLSKGFSRYDSFRICLMQVNPHIKKEKWTDDEDDRLAMLVRQFGSAWAEIARRMRGRTDQQCMGRWRRHLDPSIRCMSGQLASRFRRMTGACHSCA